MGIQKRQKAQESCAVPSAVQWHPAFYAGMQTELACSSEDLSFESEHQLGTKPREIDVLIIKKDAEKILEKNIGRIFQKHNIVEYKSPADYLSIDDFYKVYAYACLYKVDAAYVDEIKAQEITISFFCRGWPRKMLRHLQEVRKYRVVQQEEGIYYIEGDVFPMQLVVMRELNRKNNFWLRSLTDDLHSPEELAEVVQEYQKHRGNRLYQAMMDAIVRANGKRFREGRNMCEAILELFKEEVEERERAVMEQVTKEVTRQKIAESLRSIMKNLQMTAEQAMDVLEIPQEERRAYQ